MDGIILRQHDAAKKLTGKAFLLSIAGILLRLAIAQIVCNLLISWTGVGLINVAFYIYAVCLLFIFMRSTVASYVYTLKEGILVLERRLGDSTITVIEIPLESVAAMRPVRMGERLQTTYRQVTAVDPAAAPDARTRAAFVLSLFSSRLARKVAGKGVEREIGHVLVYDEGGMRHACVFCPNEQMCAALRERLDFLYGFDERMTHERIHTLYARALERAFPALYRYVDPLVRPEDVEWAKEELDARKAESQAKKKEKAKNAAAKKTGKTKEKSGGKTQSPRRRKQGQK